MTALVFDLAVGLASSVLSELLLSIGMRREAAPVDVEAVVAHSGRAAVMISLKGAVSRLDLASFLESSEVRSLVRQYLSVALTEEPGHEDDLEAEFASLVGRELGSSPEEVAEDASWLFAVLVEGCDGVLEFLAAEGNLGAADIRAGLRHRLLLNNVDTIAKAIEHLRERAPTKEALSQFEREYRRAVATRHECIIPPYVSAAQKVPVDDIYVTPNFQPPTVADPLDVAAFLRGLFRRVLLGNPGGGKSTFSTKLSFELATSRGVEVAGRTDWIPVLIVVRDYGVARKAGSSIVQFMDRLARTAYQLNPPEGAFEHWLLSGRAVVIFDGLDELLDTKERQEITRDVEAFCSRFAGVPVLVTSREVGYEQAPLDQRFFDIHRLTAFSDDQVREYAEKWFSAVDEELTQDERVKRTEAFLVESEGVPDLRSNPLMLALMCNIYRGERYIPRNRPALYGKCAQMLFDRWDKSRGIEAALPFEAHILPAMKFLAHWIHEQVELQSGVTQDVLVNKATEYLVSWRYEDADEAERAARGFIDFCKGRAWVFTDVGTTASGEPLFQFTHRTFLEYFAAGHLVRKFASAEALAAALLDRLAQEEWDMVAQLAVQMLNENIEGAADEFLVKVVDAAEADSVAGRNLIAFAVRCLAFVVPNPKVTKRIMNRALDEILNVPLVGDLEQSGPAHWGARAILAALDGCAHENHMPLSEILTARLDEAFMDGSVSEQYLATELVLANIGPFPGAVGTPSARSFLRAPIEAAFSRNREQIRVVLTRQINLVYPALETGLADVRGVLDNHGIQGLFEPFVSQLGMYAMAPFAGRLVGWLIWGKTDLDVQIVDSNIAALAAVAAQFDRDNGPWKVGHEPWSSWPISNLLDGEMAPPDSPTPPSGLSTEATFGGAILCASLIEHAAAGRAVANAGDLPPLGALDPLRDVLFARLVETPLDRIEASLDRTRLSDTHRQVLIDWALGRRSLAKSPSSDSGPSSL